MTILSFGALFAGLGVTSGATGDAALVVLGVLLGSTTWWVVLTTVIGTLRTRVTPRWIHRINLVSGVVIGAFAIVRDRVRRRRGAASRRSSSRRSATSENSVRWSPPGASSRAFIVCHGVRVAGATARRRRPPGPASLGGIVDLEGDPDVAGDPSPDLDPVDELGLVRVGDLERRPAGLEDDDAAIRR